MAKRVFTLPEGLELDVQADRVDLTFDGDVEIEQSLGRRLGTIAATGDLTVKLEVVTGDLRAGGVLRVTGEVDAGHLHGREVVLGREGVKCRAISADERITIGPATVAADVIIAPEINLDAKAQGRVTVIESQNERGATKIKGGFSLADYEDMFGNSEEFLAQRGLRPLSAGSPAASAPPPAAAPLPAPAPVSTAPPPIRTSPPRTMPPPTKSAAAPTPAKAPPPKADDEDTDDPLSLSLDDLEPLVEQAAKPTTDELHQRLSDALGRITACYEGTDLPPAVEELKDLVEGRDYDALRQNITEVWNGLLGFHQKRGIRPHHQVTHAFNVIHGLVQG